MQRRKLVSLAGVAGSAALGGCLGRVLPGCPGSEVLSVRVDPATITTPTPGSPTPAPVTGDYVVVTVRNDADEERTLVGYVVVGDGRREFSRTVPANAGTVAFEFGPFGHHAVRDHGFRLKGC